MSTQQACSGRPARVLLAGGDQVNLTHVKALLAKSGYEIVVADSGSQALQVLEAEDRPRLAVIDWMLPGLSGPDLCRQLRKSTPARYTYLILLTPWNQQDHRVEGLESGADDCLYKPVDVRELRIRLQIGAQIILERDLRESEERFRGAFESSGIGMALVKPTGEFIQVNQALCGFLGYAPEELLATRLQQILPREDLPGSQTFLGELLQGKLRSCEFEKKFVTKDGSVAWACLTISAVRDADRHPPCYVMQVQDITERKQAEAALRRSEALSRAITDHVEDLIAVISPDGKLRYASPSHLARIGYAPQELTGMDVLSLVHPDDLAPTRLAMAGVVKDKQPQVVALRLQHKDGSWRHLEAHGSPLRNSAGDVEGIVVVSRVIDDRILAEQKLQAAHAETELFLRSIPSILIGLDGAGRITRWNLTAADTFGLEEASVLGLRIDSCGVKWVHPDLTSELTRWLQTDTSYRCDSLAFESNQKVRFLGLNVQTIPSKNGDPAGFIVTGADVTERKILEDQLRQAQKLEAIGQLAAGIAHEINTPTQYVGDNIRFLKDSWAAIAGLLDLCQGMRQEAQKGAISPELLASFDRLVGESDIEYFLREAPNAIDQSLEGLQRVTKIVKAMKEFSHPGSNEMHAVDMNKAIETTVTVARNEWKYVADIALQLDEALPLVPCLAGELNQVILNLIVNAAHAIAGVVGDGSNGKGRITLRSRRDGEWVEITIRDTGGGIPAEIQPRIFEPFFTTKPVGKGTGQGLTLAHNVVVKRHHGQIWFETEMGRGTTFFIRLPLQTGLQVS